MDVLGGAEAYLAGEELLDSAGGVLYSSAASLKPAPIYILGLNPGGSDGASLRQSIAASRNGNNAYIDEEWERGGRTLKRGAALLQRRMQRIAELIRLDLRDIPASNLVFTQSRRLGEHMEFDEAVARCLPVHAMFLRAIQPKLVFTFGHISHFEKAFYLTEKESVDAKHSGWRAYRGIAKIGDLTFRLGNVPHLSVWGGQSREDVLRWALEPLV